MLFPNLVTHHVYNDCGLPPYDAQAYQYILAGNGVFVRTETPFFEAIIPVVACTVRGLPSLQFRFRLKVSRIPGRLLTTALAVARRARRLDGELNEVLYHFHHQGQTVQLKRPRQRATRTSIIAPGSNDQAILCELHSHGEMPAFFSRTDDADEQGARIYAVVGRLDTAPEIRVRLGVYGYWHPLPVAAVFTGTAGFKDLYLNKEKHPPCPSPLPLNQTDN
jgi:PRTRC genetic system protein A